MYKRLRIIIPSFQVAAFVATFALKLAAQRGTLQFNSDPLQNLIWAMNYPIWIVLSATVNSAGWLPDSWGWLSQAMGTAFAVLLIPGVALLWYWVVVEFEMLWHGKGMIRFSTRVKESVTLVLLMLFGGRALYDAYFYKPSLPYIGLHPFSAGTAQRASRLIVMVWGVALVGLAIYRLAVFIKGRAGADTGC